MVKIGDSKLAELFTKGKELGKGLTLKARDKLARKKFNRTKLHEDPEKSLEQIVTDEKRGARRKKILKGSGITAILLLAFTLAKGPQFIEDLFKGKTLTEAGQNLLHENTKHFDGATEFLREKHVLNLGHETFKEEGSYTMVALQSACISEPKNPIFKLAKLNQDYSKDNKLSTEEKQKLVQKLKDIMQDMVEELYDKIDAHSILKEKPGLVYAAMEATKKDGSNSKLMGMFILSPDFMKLVLEIIESGKTKEELTSDPKFPKKAFTALWKAAHGFGKFIASQDPTTYKHYEVESLQIIKDHKKELFGE